MTIQDASIEGKQPPITFQEPVETEPTPNVENVPPLAKWPWQMSGAAFVVVLVGMGVCIGFLWYYILHHGEDAEGRDYEQLLSLVDRVQTVTLLVLGAILGVAASGAVVKGAATVASQNKEEAIKQHGNAKRNEGVAHHNKLAAETARRDALSTADLLEKVLQQTKTQRSRAQIDTRIDDLPTLEDLGVVPGAVHYADLLAKVPHTQSFVVPKMSVLKADGKPSQLEGIAAQEIRQIRDRWRGR